jgi:hypothetical protein
VTFGVAVVVVVVMAGILGVGVVVEAPPVLIEILPIGPVDAPVPRVGIVLISGRIGIAL